MTTWPSAELLRDTEIYIDRLAESLASGDPSFAPRMGRPVARYTAGAEIAMDDMVTLCEGLRRAVAAGR